MLSWQHSPNVHPAPAPAAPAHLVCQQQDLAVGGVHLQVLAQLLHACRHGSRHEFRLNRLAQAGACLPPGGWAGTQQDNRAAGGSAPSGPITSSSLLLSLYMLKSVSSLLASLLPACRAQGEGAALGPAVRRSAVGGSGGKKQRAPAPLPAG